MLNNCHVFVSQQVQGIRAIDPTLALGSIRSVRLGTAYIIFCWKISAESVLKYICILKKFEKVKKKKKKGKSEVLKTKS